MRWIHRWSWVVAMVVAIVMTVGGLIVLESAAKESRANTKPRSMRRQRPASLRR
ncbi:MAG: hypothetical protein WDN30_15825 [Pararobbsia sp.]